MRKREGQEEDIHDRIFHGRVRFVRVYVILLVPRPFLRLSPWGPVRAYAKRFFRTMVSSRLGPTETMAACMPSLSSMYER